MNKKIKVLLVDDDDLVIRSFPLLFENSPIRDFVEIVSTNSCEEALEIFVASPLEFSIAFVDYQFRENNTAKKLGHLLVQKLKEINPELVTVIASGDESDKALKEWIQAGVDKYVYKPLTENKVLPHIIPIYAGQLEQERFLKANKQMTKEQMEVGLAGVSVNISNFLFKAFATFGRVLSLNSVCSPLRSLLKVLLAVSTTLRQKSL